jgi:hypothetical protein
MRANAAALGVVLLVGVATLGWSAWHSAPSRPAPTSISSTPFRVPPTVTGVVWVQREDAAAQSMTGPVQHAWLVISGTTSTGRPITRHTRTSVRGRFQLALPAGRYVVAQGRKLLSDLGHQTHAWFTVRRGRVAHVRIVESTF